MDTGIKINASRYACARCRSHKRRCDRTVPRCSLCTRMQLKCIYETKSPSSLGSAAGAEAVERSNKGTLALTESEIKQAIVKRLSGTTAEEVVSTYFHTIHTWFPFISQDNFSWRLPGDLQESSAELSLLLLAMLLISSIPVCENEQPKVEIPPHSNELYRLSKSSLAILEAMGQNSLDLVHVRILLILFEMGHGLYPAAYISIGALVRSADALDVYAKCDVWRLYSQTEDDYIEECKQTWRGILILDRFIASENVPWPAVTKYRIIPDSIISDNFDPSVSPLIHAFSRLFHSSALLEKIQKVYMEADPRITFNHEEVSLISRATTPFHGVATEKREEVLCLGSSNWAISNSALISLYHHGTKANIAKSFGTKFATLSDDYLSDMLKYLLKSAQPFVEGEIVLNQQTLPPFVAHLMYKAASIITERMCKADSSRSSKDIDTLRSFRKIMTLVGMRWGNADRYLKLLDEDTTPRIAKALE